MSDIFAKLEEHIVHDNNIHSFGKVTGVSGLIISCHGIEKTAIGSRCKIEDLHGTVRSAEVVGYKDDKILLMPFGPLEGIGPGCKVYPASSKPVITVNNGIIGRVINALGEPIDGKGPLSLGGQDMPIKNSPPSPGMRKAVAGKLDTGVRAINTFLTICKGQRMGIFAGSGVGKSVLMSMVAKYSTSDVNVIGLVGERGREVKEFIEEQLGPEGLKKSVIIVATGDESPLMRRQAAHLTMAIGEYFRDCGCDVMMMMDSVTRFAMAQREIGLSAGEPPTTRGYTPSVFAELPKLLERAGPGVDKGTITGIFTVLVEGSDMDEPVADAVRGILDGHIVLSRELAERGHFPAIDVLKSISRMVPNCNSDIENMLVTKARRMMGAYEDMEELIRLGAYKKGSNAEVDAAIEHRDALENFLQQKQNESTTLAECYSKLTELLK